MALCPSDSILSNLKVVRTINDPDLSEVEKSDNLKFYGILWALPFLGIHLLNYKANYWKVL